jgi:hypothetical protein
MNLAEVRRFAMLFHPSSEEPHLEPEWQTARRTG